MNNRQHFIILILLIIVAVSLLFLYKRQQENTAATNRSVSYQSNQENQINNNPLSIEVMRKKTYPGSDLIIEQTLFSGTNYNQYIASYQSDGLKIYGLLTIPMGESPQNGWPVIIFNHGYIPPDVYKTTERYIAYVDALARAGYIVFKPDYRGHGDSEGQPEGAYYSPAYTVDVLNALESIKKYPGVNTAKIGMWGHSMGGNIT